MSNVSKVLVTIGAIIIFLLVFAALTHSRNSDGNSTPGIFGLILFGGLIAGLRAIWKKSSNSTEKKDDDNFKLDKTN